MGRFRSLSKNAFAAGLLLALCTSGAIAERRALVIGNGAYRHWPKLEKAVGDAQAVSETLTTLGFTVMLAADLDSKDWARTLTDFQSTLSADDEVVVFFSGHGLTVTHQSLLIPVDGVRPKSGSAPALQGIDTGVDALVDTIQERNPRYLFFVVNAADTSSPLPEKPALRDARRLVETEAGAFILFSTREREQALDRLGKDDHSPHSVFTRVLLKHLGTPGLTLSDIAVRTRNEVRMLTAAVGHDQSPAYFDTVLDKPILNADATGTDTPAPLARAFAPPPVSPPADLGPLDLLRPVALDRDESFASAISSLAFSPDGKLLASGSLDNSIKLWDTATGHLVRTLSDHRRPIRSVAFSPDGRFVVSGSLDNTMKLWNARTGRLIKTFTGHKGSVGAVAFSDDGRTLASGSWDKTIRLWNVRRGRLIRVHKERDRVRAISFRGNTLISGGWDETITLRDVKSGEVLRSFSQRGRVRSLARSKDGTLASASDDNSIKLWDLATGTLQRNLMQGKPIRVVAFSPDDRLLASAGDDATITLWDHAAGRASKTLVGHGDVIETLAFSPDGRLLASGSRSDGIRLWDVASGERRLAIHIFPGRQWAAIGTEGYTASTEAHDFLRLGRDGSDVVDEAFQQRWLKDAVGPSGLVRPVQKQSLRIEGRM